MKLLDKNSKEIQELDLGIVEVNTSKDYEYVLHNDTEAELVDIDIEINNKEVKILESPKSLSSFAKGNIKIRWSPTLEYKKSSKTSINIKATELYKL